ncbi:Trypsin [Gracilaria domingensis]|nr:Trypsin [Gracilaria domingensis]
MPERSTLPALFVLCAASLLLLSESAVVSNQQNDSQLDHASSRVIHGVPVTDQKEYPFVVDLSRHDMAISSSRFCTGTLVTPDIVLTAAHCVLNDGYDSPVFATIGRIELEDKHSRNEHAQTFRTIASIAHPEYTGLGSPNDVALVLLNESSSAPTVKLADSAPKKDDVAWVVGYGIQMLGTVEKSAQPVEVLSGRLQKTALRIEEKSFCDGPQGQWKTADGMICTAGVKEGSSACRGDSGGGLFLLEQTAENEREAVQVGVVSYGDAKCASEESGVFTDVASNLDWIKASAEKLQVAFFPDQTESQPQETPTEEPKDAQLSFRAETTTRTGSGNERKFLPFPSAEPSDPKPV